MKRSSFPGGRSGVTGRRRYKWIAKEIDRLDPERDYERIVALSTTYYVDDFMMNFLYTTGFCYFIVTPRGAEAVARSGEGKVFKAGQKRQNDTVAHLWTWFEHGPSSPETLRSVEKVNRLHMSVAKRVPGNFAFEEDYIYTLCWLGADYHRLRLRVGLPGYTEHQKIAIHRYWRAMANHFRSEVGPVSVSRFPDDFVGMLRYMAEYEAIDWEHTEAGATATRAIIDQFAERWFPRGLRFIGRAMVLSLLGEPPHRVHRLPVMPSPVRRMFEFGFRMTVVLKERVLPDPVLSTPERKRRKVGEPLLAG